MVERTASKPKGFLSRLVKAYLERSLIWKITLGFILGLIIGLLPGAIEKLYPSIKTLGYWSSVNNFLFSFMGLLGQIFLKALKMLVMPLIFFSITLGAGSISPTKLGRVGGKIIAYYFITSAFAIVIGLIFANLFHLGVGFHLELKESAIPSGKVSLIDVLLSLIPSNPFKDLTGKNPLPVITFAIMLGIAISILREREEYREAATLLYNLFEAMNQIMFLMVQWVLEFSPFGVMGLMAVTISQKGLSVLLPFLKLIVAAYLAMITHIAVVYMGILTAFGVSPIWFLRNVKDVLFMAYVSRTSSGVLPLSMKVAHERLGVSPSVYSFSLPLGATINMDGTALYIAMETLFVANAFGIHLSFAQQATILITALLASIGTAGIPSASLILLTVVLQTLNLPLSVIPIFASFDHFCDMMRTLTNVTGDLVGTTIVAKTEGELRTPEELKEIEQQAEEETKPIPDYKLMKGFEDE